MSDLKDFDAKKTFDQIKGDKNLSITAVGAIGVLIGIFLPWYSFGGSFSASPGLNGTGIILVLFSIVAVAACVNVLDQDKRNMSILAVVVAVLAALIMLNNWPSGVFGEVVSTGIGYWLSIAGTLAMVAGSILHLREKPSTSK